MEIIRKAPLLALTAVAIATAAGCGSSGNQPVDRTKLDPIAKNKDLPIDKQIELLQQDKNMPEPEKQRELQILQSKQQYEASHPASH